MRQWQTDLSTFGVMTFERRNFEIMETKTTIESYGTILLNKKLI